MRNALLSLLLAGATIALYGPVLSYPFLVLDDTDYVTQNLHVQGGLHWRTVRWAFTSFAAANWHPLTWLSHAFDYQIFALNPAGHHLDSVLIHSCDVVLLFVVLQWITGRVGPSLLVAGLFAWHPINVESVAWVAERKNVLSTFFFFAAIGAHGWYAQKPRWPRYLTVALLFALGLMAKPMVITLPLVLLLLDYWPLGRTPGSPPSAMGAPQTTLWKLLAEKLPLLALSAASAVVTMIAQRSGYAVRTLHQFSLAARVENAVVAYALYLRNMVWPMRLAFAYPHAAGRLPAWQWILSAALLLGITAATVLLRRHRYLLVGWLWFLGTLVPVIGLVQVGDAALADRYAYLSLIGIFIMIAWGLADLARARGIRIVWLVALALGLFATLGLLTYRQIGYWDSEYDLWTHTLEATDANPFAHDALGAALTAPQLTMSREDLQPFDSDQKRFDEARRHYEQAIRMRRELARQNPDLYLPDMTVTLNNLANLARTENNLPEARKYYEEALAIHTRLAAQNLDPYPADRAQAMTNLAYLERAEQENDKAFSHFEGGLQIYRDLARHNPDQYLPSVAEALNGLAVTERDEKRMDEARRDYEEALKIRRQLVAENRDEYLPYLAVTLNDLGVLDGQEKKDDSARQHYEEALRLYRELAAKDSDTYTRFVAGSLNNLGFLDEGENRIQESRSAYGEALSLYRKMSLAEPDKYAGDVARVEGSLANLAKKNPHE